MTYAKDSPDDMLVALEVHNRSDAEAKLHVLPQLWWRNTWSWGRDGEGYWPRGAVRRGGERRLVAAGADLPEMELSLDEFEYGDGRELCDLLFTENETNGTRLFGYEDYEAKVLLHIDIYILSQDLLLWEDLILMHVPVLHGKTN